MIRSPLLLATESEQDGATRIGFVRIAVEALPLFATGLARVVFGLPKKDDTPAVRAIARVFAVRNIILGLWTLGVRDAAGLVGAAPAAADGSADEPVQPAVEQSVRGVARAGR